MTIMKHEWKRGGKAFLIWTASIAFLSAVCLLMFPEMKGQMDSVSNMFASMGSFSAAFGMDRLNFGTLIGFYAVECGNIIGLGGAFFASLTAACALSEEEKDHTAEFLLTHPVSRVGVVTQKLLALLTQILLMNLIVYALSLGCAAAIGEELPLRDITLLHTSYLLMQMEFAGVCFVLSAFLRRGGAGVGLGLATMLYFVNIIANLSDRLSFLKYCTPFGYTDGADIVTNGAIDAKTAAVGIAFTVIGIIIAYWHYTRKDIA